MICFKVTWDKLCPSYCNEEISDKGHSLVKNIVATAHDLNLEIEEEHFEELLVMHILN